MNPHSSKGLIIAHNQFVSLTEDTHYFTQIYAWFACILVDDPCTGHTIPICVRCSYLAIRVTTPIFLFAGTRKSLAGGMVLAQRNSNLSTYQTNDNRPGLLEGINVPRN